jgi:adenine phosphoribosyltransferase
MTDERIARIESLIRDVPDFPKPGIVFKDITPLLADPQGFVTTLDLFAEAYAGSRVDTVIGIESRGFIFGAALAARMSASFVPARKPGKLPAETDRVEYELEYGTDALELHTDALDEGERVLVVDDLLATGGTAMATGELARRQGAKVLGYCFVIELGFLEGRKKLEGTPITSLLRY